MVDFSTRDPFDALILMDETPAYANALQRYCTAIQAQARCKRILEDRELFKPEQLKLFRQEAREAGRTAEEAYFDIDMYQGHLPAGAQHVWLKKFAQIKDEAQAEGVKQGEAIVNGKLNDLSEASRMLYLKKQKLAAANKHPETADAEVIRWWIEDERAIEAALKEQPKAKPSACVDRATAERLTALAVHDVSADLRGTSF